MAQDPTNNKETSSSLKSLEGEMNQQSSVVDLEGKKIVLVEDDKFLADIIGHKFAETKCIFFYFAEGEEALKTIAKEMPDIIILDILLPGIDGFEILRRIKDDPNTKNIPVVLLSNLGQADDIKKGESLGANRFIIKATVAPSEIVGQIKEVLAENKK